MAENSTCEVYLTGPNGNSTPVTDTGSDGIEVSADVSAEIGNTINSVTFTKSSSGASRLYEIRVAGKLLVDSGARNLGDTRVEYQTNGGQGDIISVNTDDNTLLIANTGGRDNRWIAENKAATDFYVAGPSIVDEPLLTADVELRSTNFATTPDNADSLRNIVWELNGATQDAGTSNPYKPSGLALTPPTR